MTQSAPKYVSPSIYETAFNCPHCDALAKQHWFDLRADAKDKDGLPFRLTEDTVNRAFFDSVQDVNERAKTEKLITRIIVGAPFLQQEERIYFGNWAVYNLDISRCYNCDQIAVWVKNSLAFPIRGDAPLPNPDLPIDVRLDFEEAGRIVHISPRGAAALLRLAIQKLCKELGGQGNKLDNDIALLVKMALMFVCSDRSISFE